MFDSLIRKIFGNKHDREMKRLIPLVETINEIFFTLSDLTDEELRGKTDSFKKKIDEKVGTLRQKISRLENSLRNPDQETTVDYQEIRDQIKDLREEETRQTEEVLSQILPEAFAVVKETCRRLMGKSWKVVDHEVRWDMVPFDVQLIGGIVLHEGKIAEMATGEGKTLVATMPLYLNALVGKGTHLVTVNDYLARRDCEWMGEIYKFLGLSVAYITNDMTPEERKIAYQSDITYGTNNEFGFDYLRDNMAISMEGVVQRGHHYVIIDEVDSVLIDEARTPLIISGPVGVSTNKFAEMKPLVEKLVRTQTVLINRLVGEAQNLLKEEKEYEAGIKLLLAHRGGPKNPRLIKMLREQGIQKLIRRVEADYMRDKRLPELDEQLYYSIEEKAHTIDLSDLGREAIAPNNPDLFILPDLATELSAIEGDSSLPDASKQEKKASLQSDYAEKSERLHNISQLLRAYSLFEKDVEYVVSEDGKVMIVDEFTGRLMPGRRYSDGLHQAIEAKENVKIERETQTLATITLQNFFRLYTKLAGMTGTAETEESEFWAIYKLEVVVIPTNEPIRRVDHEDVIYKTKREKYNAIIEEIETYHDQGLPVLVGTISVEISETLSRMLRRKNIKHAVLNAKYHQKEAEIVSSAGEPGMVTIATNMAGRGTDIKLGTGVIRTHQEDAEILVKDAASRAGGSMTVVIHELSGDDLNTISSLLREQSVESHVIASAEERKRFLVSPKEVTEKQVVIIPRAFSTPRDARTEHPHLTHLKARDYASGGLHILGTERHEARRIDRQLRGRAGRQGDPGSSRFYLSLEDDLMRLFAPERIVSVMDRLGVEEGEVISHSMVTRSIGRAQKRVEMRNFEIRKHLLEYDDVLTKQREVIYERRMRALSGEDLHEEILTSIDYFVEDMVEAHCQGDYSDEWNWEALADSMFKYMLLPLPFSDDEKLHITRDEVTERLQNAAHELYKRKKEFIGSDLLGQLERIAMLRTIDDRWKEHLYEMDQIKEGIGLRAYGQKDPLLEYKQEAFNLFSEMLQRIDEEVLEICFKAQLQMEEPAPLRQPPSQQVMDLATVHEETSGMGFAGQPQQEGAGPAGPPQPKRQPMRVEHKVGRNDPCPCGSGKKYKHCHGK